MARAVADQRDREGGPIVSEKAPIVVKHSNIVIADFGVRRVKVDHVDCAFDESLVRDVVIKSAHITPFRP